MCQIRLPREKLKGKTKIRKMLNLKSYNQQKHNKDHVLVVLRNSTLISTSIENVDLHSRDDGNNNNA